VRSVIKVTRNWTDNNNDHIPDCDLNNPLANSGIDDCSIISNLNFGQNNPGATILSPDVIGDNRQYNWDMSVQLQRQLMTGVSLNVGYYRKQFYNFTVTDNLLVQPSDYKEYSVTAPADSRLPNGGGYPISGLYDLDPSLQGKVTNEIDIESKYGKRINNYDGFDFTGQARLHGGINVSGGVNVGRTRTSTCFVVDSPGALRFCDVRPPMQPNMSFVGVLPLPWYGISTSFTYRDYPGYQISATQQYTNAQIFPSLGRNLASGANGTVNVALIEPGTMYGPRQRQLDFRLSKRFRFDSKRLATNLDISNLFNSSTATAANNTFGAQWQRPTSIQKGRWAKIGVQFDF
jgi:hypothetical protein